MDNEVFEIPKGIVEGLKVIAGAIDRIWNEYNIDTRELFERLSIIADGARWLAAIDKLAEHQIAFTDRMTAELVYKINTSENVDDVISHYYFDNNDANINNLIHRCEKAQEIKAYNPLFGQIIQAYKLGSYQLACIGLFALMDGVLAEASQMQDNTHFTSRIKKIADRASSQETLGDLDKIEVAIYITIKKFEKSKELSMFYGGKFSGDESDRLKRDWLLHGRTHRDYEKIDFLKVLLWLDAIIFLSNKGTERGMQP